MMFHLAILSAVADEHADVFAGWMHKHGRTYSSSEESAYRFGVFKENHAFVTSHNARAKAGQHSFTTALNAFADMTNAEYREQVLGLGKRGDRTRAEGALETFQRNAATTPDSFDWRPLGVVTPVKDQAQCGSCWAFSAVAAMEGAYNNKMKGSVPAVCSQYTCGPNNTACCSFSEQEIVDCTLNGADTCKLGGEMHDGIMEIVKQQKGKISTEAQYPYTSGGGTSKGVCHAKPADAVMTGIKGYANVTYGDEDALKQAAHQHAIISIAIDASQMSFQFYSEGVYDEPKCHSKPDQLDHGVAIVGYGTASGPSPSPPGPQPPGPADCVNNNDETSCGNETGCHWCPVGGGGYFCFSFPCGSQTMVEEPATKAKDAATPYWIVRNSWGKGWGMDGYIKMSRNKNNQCGVASDAVYALI